LGIIYEEIKTCRNDILQHIQTFVVVALLLSNSWVKW